MLDISMIAVVVKCRGPRGGGDGGGPGNYTDDGGGGRVNGGPGGGDSNADGGGGCPMVILKMQVRSRVNIGGG